MKKKIILALLFLGLSSQALAQPFAICQSEPTIMQNNLSNDYSESIELSSLSTPFNHFPAKYSLYLKLSFPIRINSLSKKTFYTSKNQYLLAKQEIIAAPIIPNIEKYENVKLPKRNEYNYTGDVDVPEGDENMERIVSTANIAGKLFDIDVNLILAMIFNESTFNPNAISSANCRGLMQISYKYAPAFDIEPERLYEIEYNILEGTKLLTTYSIAEMGSVYGGLRAYNQGVPTAKSSSNNGSWYANKILNTYKTYKTNGFSF